MGIHPRIYIRCVLGDIERSKNMILFGILAVVAIAVIAFWLIAGLITIIMFIAALFIGGKK